MIDNSNLVANQNSPLFVHARHDSDTVRTWKDRWQAQARAGTDSTVSRCTSGGRRAVFDPAATARARMDACPAPPAPSAVAPPTLPIFSVRQGLVEHVRTSPVTFLTGATGSGKTTQVPAFLLDAGLPALFGGKGVICTQPRRVAATSVAARVAAERGGAVGGQVGYKVRFDDQTTDESVIRYETDGILLRELSSPNADEFLSLFPIIIIDEVHERSAATDLLLSHLRTRIRTNRCIRLVIMSATLSLNDLRPFFGATCPFVTAHGTAHPVQTLHAHVTPADWVLAAAEKVVDILATTARGDVLVFLGGKDEIEACIAQSEELLQERGRAAGSAGHLLDKGDDVLASYALVPLYSALPPDDQSLTFRRTTLRKVIYATNIAETSLTIDGIEHVVDAGLAKIGICDNNLGVSMLLLNPISRAQAAQRAGRAGRVCAGTCHRLYTRSVFEEDLVDDLPCELLRSPLASTVLQVHTLGSTPLQFPFITRPPARALAAASSELRGLGALPPPAAPPRPTPLGAALALVPADPASARMLFTAALLGAAVSEVVAGIVGGVSAGLDRGLDSQSLVDVGRAVVDFGRAHDRRGWCVRRGVQLRTAEAALSAATQVRDVVRAALRQDNAVLTQALHISDIKLAVDAAAAAAPGASREELLVLAAVASSTPFKFAFAVSRGAELLASTLVGLQASVAGLARAAALQADGAGRIAIMYNTLQLEASAVAGAAPRTVARGAVAVPAGVVAAAFPEVFELVGVDNGRCLMVRNEFLDSLTADDPMAQISTKNTTANTLVKPKAGSARPSIPAKQKSKKISLF